jgi:ABC transporter substrate binding protein (PQQ-dependent alcohol dehydrogenase system)
MDAFAQYLRSMNWLNVLVLVGEDPSDAGLADAFQASADRLRLGVVDRRNFTLAANPDNREGNNIKLLTSGVDYDVVFVADTRGEFGRFVPYATQEPRPVIGSVGLTAASWHWALEQDGATQVSSRFDKLTGRKIQGADWDVWIAVKSLLDGVMKASSPDPGSVRAYLTSDKMKLDGSKGVTLNYRAWDGQLRQPITLATSDAVIAVAPIDGFTHQTNTLDTLGTDEAEFVCK